MKSICIIAARGGSKGVPKKNIRLLGKKPLIAHTIESAIKSKLFTDVIVSTENKKIASIAKRYGASVPFLRPKKLATDSASMDDVLLDVIKKLKLLRYEFEIVVNRDCTAPFIKNSDIKKSINLLKRKKCHSVVAGYNYKADSNPSATIGDVKYKLFTSGSRAWSFSPSDDEKIIRSLKSSMKMNIMGTSSRGTITTDTYSLMGFSKAYQKINEVCKKK